MNLNVVSFHILSHITFINFFQATSNRNWSLKNFSSTTCLQKLYVTHIYREDGTYNVNKIAKMVVEFIYELM